MTISLCMIAKDEEKYLDKCLSSVKEFVDEMVVVDTGSADSTKEIALRHGAKVYDFKWVEDFSAARNESLKHATKSWILVLDADELIEENDLIKIKQLVRNPNGFSGFALDQRSYIKNYFEGAMQNRSGFEPVKDYPFYISNFLVRLFKNSLGISFRHRVHELVEDSMKEKKLPYTKTDIVIHHFGSLKEGGLISNKVDMYSKIILKQLEDHPESTRYSYQAARMFLGKKDFANALKYFIKTSEIDPKYKLVYSEIAKVYLHLNDKNKAIEYFMKSMELNPNNPSPANNLAVVYMSIGKFEAAKKLLEDAIRKFPDSEPLKANYEECLKNI